jgi:hypothetical protein
LKVPFRNLLVVSESSPVAGAIEGFTPSKLIRCRTRTRVAEKRPASHTNALGELFIPSHAEKCKGVFVFWHGSLLGWFSGSLPQPERSFPSHGSRFKIEPHFLEPTLCQPEQPVNLSAKIGRIVGDQKELLLDLFVAN